MPVDKLRPSFTFTEDRLAELRAVVPEAFADGAVNWEALRDALGAHLEDEGRDAEHFGLSWPGKRQARRLAAQPSKGTLLPAAGEGVDEATTRNLFIEGDNLEVLKLLQKSYAGRVKLIYIDPPYNTGQDFIYNDDFSDPLETYLKKTGQTDEEGNVLVSNTRAGGRFHSNWLNMMYPRLLLARQLLHDEGVIFVSIDDHELHNLRAMMNEVFGEENFITTVIWQKVYSPKSTAQHFSEDQDYIVVYSKNSDYWLPNLMPRTEAMNARYGNPDNDPRGVWKPGGLDARNYYSLGVYPITCPSGRVISGPPSGSYWRVSEKKFKELDKDGRIWWGKDGNSVPAIKRFLSEVRQGKVPQTLWLYSEVGHTQDAKKELLEFVRFESTDNVLDTVKPTKLLRRILHLATTPTGNDIILDFFAGSSSTAHAVLAQNREDGGNRRFIGVQIPEALPIAEKKLKTIADISKERIRNVIRTLRQEAKGKLDLGKGSAPEDLGFRVYTLARSNYKAWQDYQGDNVEELETLFDRIETPLVDGWKREDVLSEVLLLQGFPLDSAVLDEAGFKQNRIQRVESDAIGHRLFVCLDDQIVDATIERLQIASEDVFVCLDSALTDEAKLRLGDRCTLRVI